MFKSICLFAGNANPVLAQSIAQHLEVPTGRCKVSRFSDGEIAVEVGENVRGVDTFIIQPTCAPANDSLMELLIMTDALRRASAGNITAVIPYFGYARQDRKVAGRTPITAKLAADLIVAAGVQRVLTMDLHAGQIQGFFNIPVDNLFAMPVLLEAMRANIGRDAVMVTPDAGGTERTRAYAKRLDAGLVIIDKRRERANVSEVMHVIGDVEDKECLILDDMIDTAGTLASAARALKDRGARRILACATHAVFSGPALQRINDSPIEKVIVTDTIPLKASDPAMLAKIHQVSVARLLGEAIKRIHNSDSVSSLFV